jgi:hypothetical protein
VSEAALTVERRRLRLGRIRGHLWAGPGFSVTLIRCEFEAAWLGHHDAPAAVGLFPRSEHKPTTVRVLMSEPRTFRKGLIVRHSPSMTACRSAWKRKAPDEEER